MISATDFETCRAELLDRYPGAWATYRGWLRGPYGTTAPKVAQFVHKALFSLSPADLAPLISPAECDWPLHNLDKTDARREIDNFNPRPPMAYGFHLLLEGLGRVPTWREFLDYFSKDGRAYFVDQAVARFGLSDLPRAEKKLWWNAMRWRLGCAYNGFVRETLTFLEFRDRGLDLRYHLMADAEFKLDAWIGDVGLNIFVGNSRYREAGNNGALSGRKVDAATKLGGNIRMETIRLPMLRSASTYYTIWTADPTAIDHAATRISTMLAEGQLQDA